jgi:acyl phosphate:glycerol-3-phosphate acyltransferase
VQVDPIAFMLPLALRLLVCFAIGSIPFAVIAMAGSGIDIRKVGSGNPGFNNVLRVSKGRAVVALIGDLGKGYLAVWLVTKAWPVPNSWPSPIGWAWICGFAAVLGHCFSPLLRFNGGKGVATSAGVMLALYPFWAVIALVYFVISRIGFSKLKWPEAGASASLSTWVMFTMLMIVYVGRADALYAALMTIFLFARHHANLRKLVAASGKVVSG